MSCDEVEWDKPTLDGINFTQLTLEKYGGLIKHFDKKGDKKSNLGVWEL